MLLNLCTFSLGYIYWWLFKVFIFFMHVVSCVGSMSSLYWIEKAKGRVHPGGYFCNILSLDQILSHICIWGNVVREEKNYRISTKTNNAFGYSLSRFLTLTF